MSNEIKITLPDSSSLSVQRGLSVFEIIGEISKGLQKVAIAAGINNELLDLAYIVNEDASLKVYTFDFEEGKMVLWHSGSHLLAQAVKRLFPSAKLAIGPAIDNGFYYDFDVDRAFTPDDLEEIEAEMKRIIEEEIEIIREEINIKDALSIFRSMNEEYKVELLEELDDDIVSIYRQGDFVDLCRGPHLPRTSYIKAFKLLSIAGAYWRGDENNKMLQRIYGVAFPDGKGL
ncbi:MAG: TGS domain-containing protein, partial [Spirochaetota bacterium]|nr:TGS domain-containing protein [Spirochaetota bacterium]